MSEGGVCVCLKGGPCMYVCKHARVLASVPVTGRVWEGADGRGW